MLMDITPMEEADPEWEYVDEEGHKHSWNIKDINSGDWEHPTVKYVEDSPATREYPAEGHYECKKCGETIEFGWRTPSVRREIRILRGGEV